MKYLQALFIVLSSHFIIAGEISTPLNSGWQFRQGNQTAWLPAGVPGTVHTDLLKNGKIQDPFYRLNEQSQQLI